MSLTGNTNPISGPTAALSPRVNYQKLGLTFQTYDVWLRSGAKMPTLSRQRVWDVENEVWDV